MNDQLVKSCGRLLVLLMISSLLFARSLQPTDTPDMITTLLSLIAADKDLQLKINANVGDWDRELHELDKFLIEMELRQKAVSTTNTSETSLKKEKVNTTNEDWNRWIEELEKLLREIEALKEEISIATTPSSPLKKEKVYVLHTSEKKNWSLASENCLANGMSFASIESEEEDKKVMSLINAFGRRSEGVNFWIGASDLIEEGVYDWLPTGRKLTYTKWAGSGPDHSECKEGVEHCIEINQRLNNQWTDHCCNHSQFYICDYWV